MEISILENNKDEMIIQLESQTIAEILRIYLNQDSNVEFAAWKREHPTKFPILKVRTKSKNAKKAVEDSILNVIKDLDKLVKDFDGMK